MNDWAVRRLIVMWKNDSSRLIIPVAEFRVAGNEQRFEFAYLEGVREAVSHGFQPFVAFPQLGARYESRKLFPFFANRVLPTTRPDYLESLEALGLDPSQASVADVLGRTNGLRATDRIETVLVPVPDPNGRYVTHFFVRGVRYLQGSERAIALLQRGERLQLSVDDLNPRNARARKLSVRGVTIGHLPDYLIADIEALDDAGASPAVFVDRVNLPPHPVHYRVLCRVESEWPRSFVPFCDPRHAPYTAPAAA
jgi:hypothetical protein